MLLLIALQAVLASIYFITTPIHLDWALSIALIVNFLATHVHPCAGAAPDSQTSAGVTTSQMFSSLQDAPNTILNQNIRIN